MRVLTGLKPTGELQLGNYIGAIKPLVSMQEKYDDIFIFVADLHALTVYQDPSELKTRIRKFIGMYLACGVDPAKVTIYLQSENEMVPAISWLLECTTYFGEASRMIQFKEKSKTNENFSVGLLTYPVLMAADILYCDSDLVPVGIDQKQHVELARNIAERFNKKYGETFKIPSPLISKVGTKIKDLKDPNKKMSKSDISPNGVIGMFDTEKDIRKKIMGATTDSDMLIKFDEENKPGISNLINIASVFTGRDTKEIEDDFEGKNYGEFKRYIADTVVENILSIQEKYDQIINSDVIDKILDEGRDKTRKIAEVKYRDMCKKMGVVR